MTSLISSIIVFVLIAANHCLVLPLTKTNIPESSSNRKQLFEGFEATTFTHQAKINRTDTEGADKNMNRLLNETFSGRIARSNDDVRSFIRLDLEDDRQKKDATEQFSQTNLENNQHDASNLEYLLWRQYHRENYGRPRPFGPAAAASKSPKVLKNPVKMLPGQETAQIDPIYITQNNKPGATADNFMAIGEKTTTIYPSLDDNNNLLIDLLHDNQQRPAITKGSSRIDSLEFFQTNAFFSNPIFATYLAGFSGSLKDLRIPYFDKDCSMLVKTLPIFLVNNFIDALIKIGKLQLANSFLVPFIVLSVINFIVSFLFMEEYCPPDALR